MATRATGSFDVTLNPQPPHDASDGVQLGRMSGSKVFRGDLVATSTVEMLSAMSPVKGSAGYVAIERVSGKLDGRAGSFILQHTGTMTRGTPSLVITVVPDTGTGELTGLAGALAIEIVGKDHHYTFDYTIDGH